MPRVVRQVCISESAVGRMVSMCRNASPEQYAAGILWYRLQGAAVIREGAKAGLSAEQSCAIFACLSPQTKIAINWRNYRQVLTDMSMRNVRYATRVMHRKITGYLTGTVNLTVVTKGDKVTAFFHNLMGDESWVTVDTHAADCVDGVRQKRTCLNGFTYQQYASHFKVVAATLGLSNAATQALLWVLWRESRGIRDDAGMSLIA